MDSVLNWLWLVPVSFVVWYWLRIATPREQRRQRHSELRNQMEALRRKMQQDLPPPAAAEQAINQLTVEWSFEQALRLYGEANKAALAGNHARFDIMADSCAIMIDDANQAYAYT